METAQGGTPRSSTVPVRVQVDDAIATVTLADPERRNPQTPALWRALADIGHSLPSRVRVVVLRSEGPSFSAGLDRRLLPGNDGAGEAGLLALARSDEVTIDATIAAFQQAFTWWRRPGLVSVAAVQGHAVGAGFQLALATDLRILADDAQLALRETGLGLVPDLGGTKPLVDAVGYSRALEICATGRWVGAVEALSLGLAEAVVPRAELDEATADLVAVLLAAPAGAVAETKELLRAAAGRSQREQLAAERSAQARRLRALAAEHAPRPAAT